jgi:large subunit ribosomal protein L23
MNQERLLQVLLEPKISEKATRVAELNRQYVFRVLRDATKREIKAAVEQLFKVEVEAVQVSNMPPRIKGFRRQAGVRPAWKKAYVKLKSGFEIDYMGSE